MFNYPNMHAYVSTLFTTKKMLTLWKKSHIVEHLTLSYLFQARLFVALLDMDTHTRWV